MTDVPIFEWYSLIPGIHELEASLGLHIGHVIHAAVVFLLILVLAVICNRRLKAAASSDSLPDPKFTVLTFFELVYERLYGIMSESLGHHADRFVFLIGGCAFFILFSNLLGLIPGFAPPTDNINTTAALGIFIFLATHYYGVRTHGVKYLKQFMGPTLLLAPLMIPIEIIGHLARPLSLSMRLFGNIFGDHKMGVIFLGLSYGATKFLLGSSVIAWVAAPLALVIPLVTVVLGIFVSFVQTFVFMLLSMSYIVGALSEHH